MNNWQNSIKQAQANQDSFVYVSMMENEKRVIQRNKTGQHDSLTIPIKQFDQSTLSEKDMFIEIIYTDGDE